MKKGECFKNMFHSLFCVILLLQLKEGRAKIEDLLNENKNAVEPLDPEVSASIIIFLFTIYCTMPMGKYLRWESFKVFCFGFTIFVFFCLFQTQVGLWRLLNSECHLLLLGSIPLDYSSILLVLAHFLYFCLDK